MGGLIDSCRKGFSVLAGSGEVLFGALEVGACGGIVAIANLAPSECADVFRLRKEERAAEAGALQERLAPLHKSIVARLGVPGVKAALDLLGMAGGSPGAPLRRLRSKDARPCGEQLGRARLMAAAAA